MDLKINSLRMSFKGIYPALLILADFEIMERLFSVIKGLPKSL